MIIYRPVAPLTTGRTGLRSALFAMALTAVLGTSWQGSGEVPGPQDITAEPSGNAHHEAGSPDGPDQP
jgi:hypothetical protein